MNSIFKANSVNCWEKCARNDQLDSLVNGEKCTKPNIIVLLLDSGKRKNEFFPQSNSMVVKINNFWFLLHKSFDETFLRPLTRTRLNDSEKSQSNVNDVSRSFYEKEERIMFSIFFQVKFTMKFSASSFARCRWWIHNERDVRSPSMPSMRFSRENFLWESFFIERTHNYSKSWIGQTLFWSRYFHSDR